METENETQEQMKALIFQNESLKAVLEYQKQDIEKLQTRIKNFESDRNIRTQRHSEMMEFQEARFHEAEQHAFYYRRLLKIIHETPAIQSEWEKFMVYVKLSCDAEDIKQLGG